MLSNKEVVRLFSKVIGMPVKPDISSKVYEVLCKQSTRTIDILYDNVILGVPQTHIARNIGRTPGRVNHQCSSAKCRIRKAIPTLLPEVEIASSYPIIGWNAFESLVVKRGITSFREVLNIPPNELNKIFESCILYTRDDSLYYAKYVFSTTLIEKAIEWHMGISYNHYMALSLEAYIEILGCDAEFRFIKLCPHYIETWFPKSGYATETLTDEQFRELFSLNSEEEDEDDD